MTYLTSLLAVIQPIGELGNDPKALGPLSTYAKIGNPGKLTADVFSLILGVLTVAGGLWFLIQMIIGAFKWMTSGGDKNNIEQAKEHLTHAVISLAILVAVYVIAGIVGAIFGLDILNPEGIINSLKP